MLSTHAQSPAAADDLDLMLSGRKPGDETKSRSTASTHAAGTLSLSNVSSALRNASTLPMNFLPAAHERSLGTLPPGAHSTMHAATTCTTSAAGEPNDLSSPRDALSSEFKAASASLMTGSATARSREHSSWKVCTSDCSAAAASSSPRPASTASSTTAFSRPIDAMSASVAAFFSSTTTCSWRSAACRSATCALACAIFSTPDCRRSMAARSSCDGAVVVVMMVVVVVQFVCVGEKGLLFVVLLFWLAAGQQQPHHPATTTRSTSQPASHPQHQTRTVRLRASRSL